jgi:hypothetical protein
MNLALDRDKWQTLVKMVKNHQIPCKSRCWPFTFSRMIFFNGISSQDGILYTAICSSYILHHVLSDTVHCIQVYACIGILQKSLRMIADLHPLFLHSSSGVFRPRGTWRKNILALTSSLLKLKVLCINGTITGIGACKQYQCSQNWYTAKLYLNNTVLRDVMHQSGRNLLTCQRNTLPHHQGRRSILHSYHCNNFHSNIITYAWKLLVQVIKQNLIEVKGIFRNEERKLHIKK